MSEYICIACGRKTSGPGDGVSGKAVCPTCGSRQVKCSVEDPPVGEAGGDLPPLQLLDSPQPPPLPRNRPGGAGEVASDCLRALLYAVGHPLDVFVLFGTLLFGALLFAGLGFLFGWLDPDNMVGRAAVAVAMIAWYAAVYGFVVWSLLNVIDASRLGGRDSPHAELSVGAVAEAFFIWLLIGIVYTLPIVTIPLMPLAFLAMAAKRDFRALDLGWAFRAFFRSAGAVVIALLFALLWAGVVSTLVGLLAAGVVKAAMPAPRSTAEGVCAILITLVLGILGGSVAAVAVARCYGRLGFHCPEIVRSLPERMTVGRTCIYAFGMPILLVGVYIGLAANAESLAGMFRQPPPPPPPVVLSDEQQEHNRLEAIGQKLRAHLDANGRVMPATLAEFAQACKIAEADLTFKGRPALWLRPWQDGQAIFLYRPSSWSGPPSPSEFVRTTSPPPWQIDSSIKVAAIDVDGNVVETSGTKLDGQTWTSAYADWQGYMRVTYPHSAGTLGRWKILPSDSEERVRLKNLENLASDFKAYARCNSNLRAASFAELQKAGMVFDAADLCVPGHAGLPYCEVRPLREDGPTELRNGPYLAYDPLPFQKDDKSVMAFLTQDPYATSHECSQLSMYLPTLRGRAEFLRELSPIQPADSPTVRAIKNLRNLRVCLQAYAKDHDNQFPESLEELQKSGYLKAPASLRSPLNRTVGYVYYGSQYTGNDAGWPLLFDPNPLPGCGQFAACHVGFDVLMYEKAEDIRRAFRGGKALNREKAMTFGPDDKTP